MTLPDCEVPKRFKEGSWGLGYCPKTNQFQVVKVFSLKRDGNGKRSTDLHRMVSTIGTGTWRSITAVRKSFVTSWRTRYDSAFFNGSLHWVVSSGLGNLTCTFNFETEQFGSCPSPPSYAGNNLQLVARH
ncbi:unnamed protein product [Dovyalis caffra]|uniref:F-box associated beta-propeller type 1 domain-containing protein n=1 Tax=Dovyalis caffra TaxID=77055 RepID=A0AAV1RL75_9ROSI|nr:unnamed protein product [Dovyalis caffra]